MFGLEQPFRQLGGYVVTHSLTRRIIRRDTGRGSISTYRDRCADPLYRRRPRIVRDYPLDVALDTTLCEILIVKVKGDDPAWHFGFVRRFFCYGGAATSQGTVANGASRAFGDSPLFAQRAVLR